jgi:hypothetical protein
MAVTDLHSLDISTPIDKLFSTGATIPGAVLSLVQETPQINVGDNVPLVISGRAKGALVHEGGAKPDNGRTPTPKPFTTAKLVYSQRVTDEFMQWDETRQGDYVSRLVNDWVTKSLPRDIDTVVIHGVNPTTGTVDTTLSDYIRKAGSSTLVPRTGTTAAAIDTDLGTAVKELDGQNVTGIAISGDAASKLGTVSVNNQKKYPELGLFGLTGNNLAGKQAASTPEVGEFGGTELIVADWSQLLLGFAGDAEWKTIEFGDPDNTGIDLQGHNQVCIRLELKFGFRVLDADAFVVVAAAA